jgi:fucose 4-O-acetylase-like acetyltransferase
MKVHGLLEKNDSYALRGVCMIMIIVHHTYLSAIDMPGCHTDSWLAGVGTGWLWGYGGTGVFLFLSGFGMFFSLRRNRLSGRAYIRSKFIRLFIPYLWLWAVSLIIYILYDSSQLTPRLLTSFLSLDIPPANEAWFYKVIIGLYALSIVIFKVFSNPRTCVLAVASVCVAYYCLANYVLGMDPWWFITVLNFPSGMLTALFYDKLRHIQPVYVILPGTLLFALLQYFHPNPTISSLLFSTVMINAVRYVNISNRILGYIGTNSLLFYFLEEPAIDYLARPAAFSFYSYSIAAVLTTLLLVFLCRRTGNLMQRT